MVPKHLSQQPAIIRPVQQGLALARAASPVAGLAGATELSDMAANGLPAANLSLVLVEHAAALVVAAIPLEPATRIVGMYPASRPPDTERLASIYTEPVEGRISVILRQARLGEPAFGEFVAAISHVLAAEDSERQHLGRCQVWSEIGMEVATGGRDKNVSVALLHTVVHVDTPRLHRGPFAAAVARLRRQMAKLRAAAKLTQTKYGTSSQAAAALSG